MAAKAAATKAKLPAEKLNIVASATQELLNRDLSGKALGTGDTITDFTLPNARNEAVKLSDALKDNTVVLSFYRGGWCPYCNMELRALQAVLPQIEAQGAKLIAVSPEVPDMSLSTAEKNELSFEVLSDVNNVVAKQLNLTFQMPEDLQQLYKNDFNIHVDKHNGNEQFELPMPATYVINQRGEVVYDFVSEHYTQRAEPSEILEVLNKLQQPA